MSRRMCREGSTASKFARKQCSGRRPCRGDHSRLPYAAHILAARILVLRLASPVSREISIRAANETPQRRTESLEGRTPARDARQSRLPFAESKKTQVFSSRSGSTSYFPNRSPRAASDRAWVRWEICIIRRAEAAVPNSLAKEQPFVGSLPIRSDPETAAGSLLTCLYRQQHQRPLSHARRQKALQSRRYLHGDKNVLSRL